MHTYPYPDTTENNAILRWIRTAVRGCMFSVLLCLVACNKTPQLPPLPSDGIILSFGDSLTFGTGAGETESYPAVLARMTGHRVVNAGVPGEVSASGVQRLPEVLERERPAVLILCHGGNDLLQRLDQQLLTVNMRTMIKAARERGIAVILVAVPSLGITLTPPPLYQDLATEFSIPIESKALPRILGKSSLKSDHIHPNAAGYRLLAEAIYNILKKSGALPR
jgi:acyl-CoA thioesterase-1